MDPTADELNIKKEEQRKEQERKEKEYHDKKVELINKIVALRNNNWVLPVSGNENGTTGTNKN